MADIKISELGAASAVNSTDIFPMTSAGITVKATAQQIKNYMGVGNLADLTTDDKTSLVKSINEVDAHADATQASANIVQAQVSDIDDAYDPTKPYQYNDLCIHDNVLYRCITACSAGSWATNQSCFIADTLTNVGNVLKTDLNRRAVINTYTLNSGARTISNVSQGDIFIFSRNETGIIAINRRDEVATIVAVNGITNISYNNSVLSFTRTSQYTGDVICLTRGVVAVN